MKSKLLLTLLLAFTGLSTFAQQSMHVPKPRPADFEYYSAPDSTGKRTFLKSAASKTERTAAYQVQLPYPIIFIHGLNSDADTWDATTSFMTTYPVLQNGGRFDYCLNYNYIDYGDYSNPNIDFWPDSDADIAVFSGTWSAGDFYYVNFDVGADGSYDPSYKLGFPYVESNQAAVVKQAVALRDAIYRVLQLTGRNKVVLIGHSMGGLAAREYLQNSNLWQPDEQHHIAKLVTTGTPHGGSNAGTEFLETWLTGGIDPQSEACRDLRTFYDESGEPGVYLFGGVESGSVLNESTGSYYNIDVNCDGNVGETVTGLDQKDIYTDLDFACIIGLCTDCGLLGQCLPGDGVVNDTSANLNTFYTDITTNVFDFVGEDTKDYAQIHTQEPSQYYQNMQGLDEPEYYNLAYQIGLDTTYTGFMTVPSATDPYSPWDIDFYQCSVPVAGNVTVSINNIIVGIDFGFYLYNSNLQLVDSATQRGSLQSINFTAQLDADNYYLEIFGQPDASSFVTPYHFILSDIPITTGIVPSLNLDNIQIYPNPSDGTFTISSSTLANNLNIKVTNVLGEEVYQTQMLSRTTDIDLSKKASGVYFVQISSDNGSVTKKIVIDK